MTKKVSDYGVTLNNALDYQANGPSVIGRAAVTG